MKIIIALILSASFFSSFANAQQKGKYTCETIFDSTTKLAEKMNAVCDMSRDATMSTFIRPTGSVGMTFCCIGK